MSDNKVNSASASILKPLWGIVVALCLLSGLWVSQKAAAAAVAGAASAVCVAFFFAPKKEKEKAADEEAAGEEELTARALDAEAARVAESLKAELAQREADISILQQAAAAKRRKEELLRSSSEALKSIRAERDSRLAAAKAVKDSAAQNCIEAEAARASALEAAKALLEE